MKYIGKVAVFSFFFASSTLVLDQPADSNSQQVVDGDIEESAQEVNAESDVEELPQEEEVEEENSASNNVDRNSPERRSHFKQWVNMLYAYGRQYPISISIVTLGATAAIVRSGSYCYRNARPWQLFQKGEAASREPISLFNEDPIFQKGEAASREPISLFNEDPILQKEEAASREPISLFNEDPILQKGEAASREPISLFNEDPIFQKEEAALREAISLFNEDPISQPISPGWLPNSKPGLDNVCYMNSILQLLAQRSEEELEQLLNTAQGEHTDQTDIRNNFKWALFNVLAELQDADAVVPQFMIHTMINQFNRLRGAYSGNSPILEDFRLADGRQADSTECLRGFLALLDHEYFTTLKTITSSDDSQQNSHRLDTTTPALIPITISINASGGMNMQQVIDDNFSNEAIEFTFAGGVAAQAAIQATFFPVSRTLTFAIENRIYYDQRNHRNDKNTTALILDPILCLPVFNPENCKQRGRQRFRVRAVVLHSGGANDGHYTTQVFGPQNAGGYGWREYNDNKKSCDLVDHTKRQFGSRIVEYVPYGSPIYD